MKESRKAGKWIVNVKGSPDAFYYEISVVRSSNEHGLISYGWFNDDKLLVSHNGGPCRQSVAPKIWDKLLKVAEQTAVELNSDDGRNSP